MDWDTITQTGARTSGVEEPTPRMAVLGAKLEQSKMVRILGLQRAHQNIKRRKLAQVFEVRVFQEKRPARFLPPSNLRPARPVEQQSRLDTCSPDFRRARLRSRRAQSRIPGSKRTLARCYD